MSHNSQARPLVLVEFSPSGGLFQFAFQLGEALAADGTPVQLITGPDPELTSHLDNFVIRPILPTWHKGSGPNVRNRLLRLPIRAFRAGRLVLAWIVLGAALLATRPRAVIWQHWRFTFEPFFVTVIAKLLRRRAFGASLQSIIAHEPVPRSDARDTSVAKSGELLDRAFRSAWQAMDVAFVLGPHTRTVAIEAWQPRCPVVVIPHGSERALLEGGVEVSPADETDPVALFFGTWAKYKGIEVLLDAFEIVRRKMPEAQLHIVGEVGADIDEAAILQHAADIGGVTVTPGYLPIDQLPSVIGSARCVVTPYTRASQSGVIHLAFTFGRPVVTSDTGDLGFAVTHEKNGLVVPTGEAEPLATAILELLRSPERAREYGEHGRAHVATAWDVAAQTVRDSIDAAFDGNDPA